ncbi:MAG: CDP-glycerol glycerophosphotransferase family protein [Proteobacteria bacterium]|nr:CDP-glycerol glycerophosphotransferase family protein [Pseudomonadota bacterium]
MAVKSVIDSDLLNAIEKSGLFDARYYLSAYPFVSESALKPFQHFMEAGWKEQLNPSAYIVTADFQARREGARDANPLLHCFQHGIGKSIADMGDLRRVYKEIARSGLFDIGYYLQNNPRIGRLGADPLLHFLVSGVEELSNPSAAFDIWWYVQEHLDGRFDQNPLLHYIQEGRSNGLLTKPPTPVVLRSHSETRSQAHTYRRICLFAGYDRDGQMDDTVVEYVTELSKFSDVYYLADCKMDGSQLLKLSGITRGAWAIRHGAYDFGSWSKLARELVGWETIETYDELLLVNDSCYLLRPLDEAFSTMARSDADWWGMQAGKGLISTWRRQGLAFDTAVTEVKAGLLTAFEDDPEYDFFVASYFLAYRSPVFNDQDFRQLLNSVAPHGSKKLTIKKYEIGLTRWLLSRGYDFDAYLPKVYAKNAVFSDIVFDVISEGFPLLKRYFLSDNHYQVSGLDHWQKRLRMAGIEKDLSHISRNLERVSDAKKLHTSLHVAVESVEPPFGYSEMEELDLLTPKYDSWWAFPVCAFSHLLNDNLRALFEFVANNPRIKKIVLTRTKNVPVKGENVVVVPLQSREGQFYLLRSRHVFIKHATVTNTHYRLSPDHHRFHNLWHGIPLKRINYASLDFQDNLAGVESENRKFASVISASEVDRLAMTAGQYPLTYQNVWVTGLPRHDFIMCSPDALAPDLREDLRRLEETVGERKLLLFMPTFRTDQVDGYYKFSPDEVEAINAFLSRNNMVMGIREHMADEGHAYARVLSGDNFIDLSEARYPQAEVLYRRADVLLTDYSSSFIDFLITRRPVVSFAYDLESYAQQQRGFFYDLEWCFPGPVARDFSQLMLALEASLLPRRPEETREYEQKARLFLSYRDDRNSERVAAKVVASGSGSSVPFARSVSATKRTILWVYGKGEEGSARYRVFALAEQMFKRGWGCLIADDQSVSMAQFAAASIVIISRVAVTDQISDFCQVFQATGGLVVADIDDLIFGEAIEESEYALDRSDAYAKIVAQSYGVRRGMRLADYATVSTAALVEEAQILGCSASVIPNAISDGLIARYSSSLPDRRAAETIRICYLSGTRTHRADFMICAEALKRVLESRRNVEIHIVGALAYDSNHDEELKRGFISHQKMSYEAMHAFLSGMDINLAPLKAGRFNDCKSELKVFEAALHAVPTIASPTGSYRDCIEHGVDGYLPSSQQDWFDCVLKLVDNADERQRVGLAARARALAHFSAKNSASRLEEVLSSLLEKGRAAGRDLSLH